VTDAIPTTEFRGWVKCHRPEQRDALGDLVFDYAFPFFLGGGDGSKPKFTENEEFFVDIARKMGRTVEVPAPPPRTHRRFAGDLTSTIGQERGNYYPVCDDAEGSDYQTLANELNAYVDPRRSGFVYVHDLVEPLPPHFQRKPGWLVVSARDVPGVPSPIIEQASQRNLLPVNTTTGLMDTLIPYRVSAFSIGPILDLREPAARAWLQARFQSGIDGWLESVFKPKLGTFERILPQLMDITNGGNWVTDMLGAYLRSKGVAGLIFPSARCNVVAAVQNRQLVRSRGWNLVDYRNAADKPTPRKVVLIDEFKLRFSDDESVDDRIRVAFAPHDSDFAGSFRVEGNIEHHNLMRHALLCFSAWQKAGDDTTVVGYRWHSTRTALQDGQKYYGIACLSCSYSSAEALGTIPHSCPRCHSRTVFIH
jgi:hypothetical protein